MLSSTTPCVTRLHYNLQKSCADRDCGENVKLLKQKDLQGRFQLLFFQFRPLDSCGQP
ncbi:hypothetical protein ERO13_A09G141050v2 [Gossypium hirsutum]|nr:hypothetical protein ERO13_A09G141050v2 [Gossypium hirsutum]